MKKMILGMILVLLVALVIIQFIPVDRSNPAVTADMPTSPEVKAILKRACYDCHSYETVWPWYSYVAPVSWWVAKDVHQGREELNFSTWDVYSTKERVEKMHESWEEVEEGEMPPWFYTSAHRDARLSREDRAVLRTWALASLETRQSDAGHKKDGKN